jgi:tRNA (guanosine-2'-O-)-methyltransferase
MHLFLDAPQLFENLCGIARTLEVLGVRHCYVYDPNKLVRPHYGKSRTRQARTASAGAWQLVHFERVEEPGPLLRSLGGRVVATVADEGATPLTEFAFEAGDTIVFGSEVEGVHPDRLALAHERLTIPRHGVTQSLNLSVAVGIVVFEALRQLGDAGRAGGPGPDASKLTVDPA